MEQADTIGVELSFELCANFARVQGKGISFALQVCWQVQFNTFIFPIG